MSDLDPNEVTPPAPDPSGDSERFFVVALGASAGGLKALESFFDNAPPDDGIAYVVVTHQHSGQSSLLPELLGNHTQLRVVQAKDGTALEPNKVFLPPPGKHLKIESGVLWLVSAPAGAPGRLPIDAFFRSLALDLGHRAIGVILSGTGSDGTEGLRAIKGTAGMVLAQDETSAEHEGMPRSAIATGLVDFVLPPEALPEVICRYVHSLRGTPPASSGIEFPPPVVEMILLHLRQRTGHDFTHYKMKTIRRRLERRLLLHGVQTLPEYVSLIRQRPDELDALFQELLIGVTSFFRDPAAFAALEAALAVTLEDKPDGYQVRAWVPGCSTGEEAYSIAIALRECFERLGRRMTLQIFATDINPQAIDTARRGRYGAGIAADLSPERLSRWFKETDGLYQVNKSIREHVIFAPQDMLTDPPFTRLDLLSCRNVLIYLQSDLQRRLLPMFHYALKPDGIMFLGSSESTGGFQDLFTQVDKKWKVFRRRIHSVPKLPALRLRQLDQKPVPHKDYAASLSGLADRFLLDTHCPPSVVVTEKGEILHVRGSTGFCLEPAQGRPNLNVLNMAREGLAADLATIMREVTSHQLSVSRLVRVRTNSDWTSVEVEVSPIERRGLRGALLITFRQQSSSPKTAPEPRESAQEGPSLRPIERELAETRSSLQSTVEELEASNEELKSTNEELQSTNEELQSTNEELETSKEELQSLNEELQTVNAELQEKLGDLSRANDDMTNLLNSTDIATVFLDDALRIKRFTPQAKGIFQLIETDVGRPITDLASQLKYLNFESDAKEVIRSLIPKKLDLRTEGGTYFLTRIMPYRTADNRLDGLVVTFVDTTPVQEAKSLAMQVAHAVALPLLVLGKDLRVFSANQDVCEVLHVSLDDLVGSHVNEIWNGSQFREVVAALEPGEEVRGVELRAGAPRGGTTQGVRFNAKRLEDPTQYVLTFDLGETASE